MSRYRPSLALACLLGLVLLTPGCAWLQRDLQRPEVAIGGLRLGPGQGLYQSVLVDLVITNPNAQALRLDAISYRVRVQGRELVNGLSRDRLEVPAGGTTLYTVPATLNMMNSLGLVRELLSGSRSDLRYELEATLEPSGFLSWPITLRKSDSLPLAR